MLRAEEAKAIATALDFGVQEVYGEPPSGKAGPGFADEITIYVPGPGDPFRGLESEHHTLYKVNNNALDELRIFQGDVVVVDISAAAVENLEPLKIVWVQYHPDPEMEMDVAVSMLRQFVPPALLITNSKTNNLDPINMNAGNNKTANIMGVVVSVHRPMQG